MQKIIITKTNNEYQIEFIRDGKIQSNQPLAGFKNWETIEPKYKEMLQDYNESDLQVVLPFFDQFVPNIDFIIEYEQVIYNFCYMLRVPSLKFSWQTRSLDRVVNDDDYADRIFNDLKEILIVLDMNHPNIVNMDFLNL